VTTSSTEVAAATLAGLTALNAFGGAIYGLKGAPAVPGEWLEGSPFPDYRLPSAILGTAVGGTCAVATLTALRGSPSAPRATILAGGTLIAWITAQVGVIGFKSRLQPLMGGVGVLLVILGAVMSEAGAAGRG
jgi:hypothetical protein